MPSRVVVFLATQSKCPAHRTRGRGGADLDGPAVLGRGLLLALDRGEVRRRRIAPLFRRRGRPPSVRKLRSVRRFPPPVRAVGDFDHELRDVLPHARADRPRRRPRELDRPALARRRGPRSPQETSGLHVTLSVSAIGAATGKRPRARVEYERRAEQQIVSDRPMCASSFRTVLMSRLRPSLTSGSSPAHLSKPILDWPVAGLAEGRCAGDGGRESAVARARTRCGRSLRVFGSGCGESRVREHDRRSRGRAGLMVNRVASSRL